MDKRIVHMLITEPELKWLCGTVKAISFYYILNEATLLRNDLNTGRSYEIKRVLAVQNNTPAFSWISKYFKPAKIESIFDSRFEEDQVQIESFHNEFKVLNEFESWKLIRTEENIKENLKSVLGSSYKDQEFVIPVEVMGISNQPKSSFHKYSKIMKSFKSKLFGGTS